MNDDTAQDPLPKSFLTLQDSEALFSELGLANLSDERKQSMLDMMIDTIMGRVFQRIDPILTDQDRQMLEDFELRPDADQAMMGYLVSVVPNLDAIMTEEILNYKKEIKMQIDTIVNTIEEEVQLREAEGSTTEPPVQEETPQPVEPDNNFSSPSQIDEPPAAYKRDYSTPDQTISVESEDETPDAPGNFHQYVDADEEEEQQ